MKNPYLIGGLTILFALIDLVILGFQFDLSKSDWAAWVQAIGATAGIAIAIAVPWNQSRRAKIEAMANAKDAERRVCMAFEDELLSLNRAFLSENMRELLRTSPDGFFEKHIPSPRNRFPIFVAMVGQLTIIESSVIRRGITEAYTAANQLVEAGELNNHLIEQYNLQAQRLQIQHDAFNLKAFEAIKRQRVDLTKQMKYIALTTIERVENILPLLAEAVR